MLSEIINKLEEMSKLSDELGDMVDVFEDSFDNDIDSEKFSQINPKDYIYWLFNTDTDGNSQKLIDELSYWNSGRGEV